jgi:hypothetical protein
MTSTRRLLLDVGPLVVWTALIWISRIRNIWEDDDLSTRSQTISTLIAVVFVVLAVVTAVILYRSRRHGLSRISGGVIMAFAAGTIGYWVVRGIEILFDDHSGGFKLLHTMLALVSCALAALAWRAVRGISDREVASVGAGAGR